MHCTHTHTHAPYNKDIVRLNTNTLSLLLLLLLSKCLSHAINIEIKFKQWTLFRVKTTEFIYLTQWLADWLTISNFILETTAALKVWKVHPSALNLVCLCCFARGGQFPQRLLCTRFSNYNFNCTLHFNVRLFQWWFRCSNIDNNGQKLFENL